MKCDCGTEIIQVKYDDFPDENCYHCPTCDIDIIIEENGKRIIVA